MEEVEVDLGGLLAICQTHVCDSENTFSLECTGDNMSGNKSWGQTELEHLSALIPSK